MSALRVSAAGATLLPLAIINAGVVDHHVVAPSCRFALMPSRRQGPKLFISPLV
jgi:hypothetical protein